MSHEKTAGEIAWMDDLVIVPVGSLEQHSRHLPVSTDIILAQAFGDIIGERLNAFVLPALPISTAYEHKGVKGSVWMNADTFFHMLCDIVLNLKEQGFRRVVVIKGHGGIFVMDPAIRHLNANHMPNLKVCQLDPFFPVDGIFKTEGEVHSGEMETSLMLHLRPDLVKMENAIDFLPDVPRPYLQYGSVFSYSPDGVWGNPTLATAEKGRKYFEACVEESIKHIETVFNVMGERAY
jgi:creatinine amidohydrolase